MGVLRLQLADGLSFVTPLPVECATVVPNPVELVREGIALTNLFQQRRPMSRMSRMAPYGWILVGWSSMLLWISSSNASPICACECPGTHPAPPRQRPPDRGSCPRCLATARRV